MVEQAQRNSNICILPYNNNFGSR